jgi:dTDP-4-amino-4,6-dideoxygalactose transaminase
MSSELTPFKERIYVTRPVLPDLNKVFRKLNEIWDAKWLTNNGDQHQLLERKLVDLLKVPYLSLFNNGTTALMVAIHNLGLTGEVITTPFTFPATPHVLTWKGIKPVFCDIDPETMNIDPNKIEALISPQTTGILGVHVFGNHCNVVRIQEIADRYGLKVVYDAAHAFQTEFNHCGIGNFGDITMFSFHATKLFHTVEGGALAVKDPDLKVKIDLSRNFGIKSEAEVLGPGINGKMNEIQAAIGLLVLEQLDSERQKRKILADTYWECLKDTEGLKLLHVDPKLNNSYQFLVIRIEENSFGLSRDQVCQRFKEYNIHTRRYFYPLCSDYPHYQPLPSASSPNLPVARQITTETLALPFYGELAVDEVRKICAILKSFAGGK